MITAEIAEGAERTRLNGVSGQIVDAATRVHRALGPGLLESAYRACLAFELRDRNLRVETEVPLPVVYRVVRPEVGYRLDLLVENQVVVEIKSVESLIAHPPSTNPFLFEDERQETRFADQL